MPNVTPPDDLVVLVDPADRPTGTAEKMRAHREGLLHRALSVFVFNDRDELLLQQRALSKYHSPGLWSNTCCSHPRLGEEVLAAAHRRLVEEMGFDCPLWQVAAFVYHEELANELIEHEYDHVLIGRCEEQPMPSADEVAAWRWVPLPDLGLDMRTRPERYTVWLGRAVGALLASGAVSPSGAPAAEG